MLAVLSWWVLVEVFGLLALPIALHVFRHLPERGYALAKPLGLLLCGYLLWIGCSLGFLSNTRGAMLFVMLLVGTLSAYLWSRERAAMLDWLRENTRVILAVELVFLLAFVSWAVVRAYNPNIEATEKPMEIGFLNAILRSERFTPHDPWLSGFGISYYYFGYLLIAILTSLSGVAASVAFNLAIALLFALTAMGTFGLVYDLIATDMGQRAKHGLSAIVWALLGPVFVVLIGNLEGLFEVLHTRGLGSASFWKWLDVEGLAAAPQNGRWIPTDSWWWWRASRVVNDRDLAGGHMEVIDEFPQFSFLLGDMHPHVLNLPFVMLALGLALNVLLGARAWMSEHADMESPPGHWPWLAKARRLLLGLWHEHAFELLILALCLGSMGFINAWDLPIYLLVLVGAFVVGQLAQHNANWFSISVAFGASVAIPAILFYLPFYLGFQSQAGGVLPQFFNTTHLHQYLLMFGLFIFVLVSLIVSQILSAARATPERERGQFWKEFLAETGNWLLWLVAGPLLVMALAVISILITARGRQFLQSTLENSEVQKLIGNAGVPGLLRQTLWMRLGNPGTFVLIVVLLSCLLYLLQRGWRRRAVAPVPAEPALWFIYLIAGVGLLLTLGVEFVYLRDLFDSRMNTVFKFYYQAWVLMAIAAAFGSYYLLGRPGIRWGVVRSAWLMGLTALVAAGMIYPVLGIPNRTGDFKGKATLDGKAYLQQSRPDDYAAICWLQEHAPRMAYIVEAYGGSYSDAGFVSAFTGLPTILGWDFHEDQWRGNDIEPGKRRPDVDQIYKNPDSQQVLTMLEKYGIKYVYVGSVERRKYELTPTLAGRFGRFLEKVFEQGSAAIYQR